MAYKARKRKVKKNIPTGCVHIQATFNNTIVTISDEAGNAVSWASAGAIGYKGSKKSTPFAAQMASESAAKKALPQIVGAALAADTDRAAIAVAKSSFFMGVSPLYNFSNERAIISRCPKWYRHKSSKI